MDAAASFDSTEELREALLAVTRERDALMLSSSHAQHLLDALESLLSVGEEDDPFERVFAALRKVFTFSHSMLLAQSGDDTLECIVGNPQSVIGSRWTAGPLFKKVLGGRVVTTFSSTNVEEWRDAAAFGLSCDQSALYAPVRVRERRGILVLLRPQGDAGFDRNDVELARKFSLLASHALAARYASEREVESRNLRELTEQLRASERELARRAFHDQLTGLPNRALMAEIVDAALRLHARGGMFALAFIDLDNFKQINDFYSHATGDALLVAVAERVRANIRPADTLARISGDEFLLLFNPLARPADLPPLVDRIVEALKQPFTIEGREVFTSASVGASIYPLHGDTYEGLRRCADAAMYRAKRNRKGSASYFDAAIEDALSSRMQIEQRLRAAIRARHFRAAFQPKVSLQSGRITGFEALARWVEPDGTVRMPGSFIDLAGELGLIDEISRFMLDDVVAAIPQLTQAFGAKTSVSLNVSARQVEDRAFMRSFIAQIAACGVPDRIVLELTEDALLSTQRFQGEVLPMLRDIGVRVSIDDFGRGYSSLSALADITADEVKIDRAFISGIHERTRSQGILKAIESLCCALDVNTVAEGVESAEEVAYLRNHTAIRCAQGYYYSRPMFVEALLAAPSILPLQAAPQPQSRDAVEAAVSDA